MTTLYSNVIEIPGLELSKSQLITNVPTTTATWTYNANPRQCTQLAFNFSTGLWQPASGGTAYAAAAKSFGATVGDIMLLPYAYIWWQKPGVGTSSYGIYVVNNSPLPSLKVRKQPGIAFAANAALYFNAASNWVTNSSSGNLYIGSATVAALATDDYVYYQAQYAGAETGTNVNPAACGVVSLPHVLGAALSSNTRMMRKENGEFVAYSATPAVQGIATKFYTVESIAANVSSVRCVDARNFTITDWKQLLCSVMNNNIYKLIPDIGVTQQVTNSESRSVYQVPKVGLTATYTRLYSYQYRLGAYVMLKTMFTGAMATVETFQSMPPVFVIPIPGGLTWNYDFLDDPTKPYFPPGPIDLSSTHHFVATTTDPNTTSSVLTWLAYRKSPPSGTHPTKLNMGRVMPYARQFSNTIGPYCDDENGRDSPLYTADHGASDVDSNIVDPTRVYTLEKVFFEGGTGAGTMRLDYQVVRVDAVPNVPFSSVDVPLTGWITIPRVPWFSDTGLDFIKFPLSLTLSGLGVTAPALVRTNVYKVNFRQYYISVSPYQSFSVQFGNWVTSSMNEAGGNWSYGNRQGSAPHNHPFYGDVPTTRLISNQGDAITFDGLRGYAYPRSIAPPAYTGTVTITVTPVSGTLFKVKFESTVTPDQTMNNLVGNVGPEASFRISRVRDGRYVYPLSQFYTPAACVWSYAQESGGLGYTSTTAGTGRNYQFNTAWTSYEYWVDKAAAGDSEPCVAEVQIIGYTTYQDKSAKSWAYRFVLPFTI